jgi:uncharacterized protein YggE
MNNENIKSNVWKAGLAVGILLALFLLIISIRELKKLAYVGRDVPIMNAITVTGKGEAISIPDIATFSFSVTETAREVTDAQSKATTKINAVLKSLKDSGVAEKDIKTASYTINPRYEYQSVVCSSTYCPPSKSVLTGYDVSQTIEVKVRDLKKAGALFALIGSQGVQNVSGLTFSIDDIDTVKARARSLAIENAKDKAKDLSKQLGVRIVRITGFYDQSDEPIYYGREAYGGDMVMKAGVEPAVPQVPAGEQKITSRVSITYEIR